MMVSSGFSLRRASSSDMVGDWIIGDMWRLSDLCCLSSPHGRSTVPGAAGAAEGRCSTLGGIALPRGTSRRLLPDLLTSRRLLTGEGLLTGGRRYVNGCYPGSKHDPTCLSPWHPVLRCPATGLNDYSLPAVLVPVGPSPYD